MKCQPSTTCTEHEFVARIVRQGPGVPVCCGPLVRQGFTNLQLAGIHEALVSSAALDLLREHSLSFPDDALYFELCALHWMNLACLITLHGHLFDNRRWRITGQKLLGDVCQTQGWDPKEIANAFTWQRVRLT